MKILSLGLAAALVASAMTLSSPASACSFKVSSGMLKGDSFARVHKTQHPVSVAVYNDPSTPLSPTMKNLAEMLRKVGHRVRVVNNLNGLQGAKSQIILSANLKDADKIKKSLKLSARDNTVVVPIVDQNNVPKNIAGQYATLLQSNSSVSVQLSAVERVATRVSVESGATATAVLAAP